MTSQRTLRIKPRILTPFTLFIAALTVLLAAPAIAQNPVPFINQPLVPDAAAPGGPGFTLTVNGAWFLATSVVNWNGSPLATTFVSSSQLTAAVPASDIATASTAAVTVVNPSPGGGVSNIQYFSITVPDVGSVGFLPAVVYGSNGFGGATSVAIGDVNGDGKPDLVVGNSEECEECSSGGIGVLLGNGDGTFQSAVLYSSGPGYAGAVAVANLRNNGKADVIVAGQGVSVMLGNGNGTFQSPVTYSVFGNTFNDVESVVVADVNGDSKLDLIVATSEVNVLLGRGDGTFKPAVVVGEGGCVDSSLPQPSFLAVADVNGDGKPDLLVTTSYCSQVEVLLGNGNGTFQSGVYYGTGGVIASSVTVADVNGDGKPDLLVANEASGSANGQPAGPGSASVLLGNGDGTFQAAVVYPSGGPNYHSIAVADVNGDGNPDLLLAACSNPTDASYCGDAADGSLAVLLGNGDGTFQTAVFFDGGGFFPLALAVADLNQDGRPDAVVANWGGSSGNPYMGTVGVLINNTPPRNPTTTALTSSPNPAVVGETITFTATVISSAGSPPNGEIVTFYNGAAVLGTAPLSGGTTALATSSLPAGIYTITATYPGDANFAASTSPGLRQVVNSTTKSATSTTLASSLNPSIYGQSITWTATVATSGSIAPTGTVNFNWGGRYSFGSATLNSSGVATLTRSTENADTYAMTAVYPGDTNNLSSTSAVVNQVIQQAISSATLTSSPNPSNQGEAVTFTATINSPTNSPTGPVTFTAGSTVLGTVELKGRVAKLTISTLAVGSTTVTATYYGDSNIAESSASVIQNVQQ